ncbi:dephospho-CoA kinase [Alkalihalobacillus alcalophilus ATCC 27647 = CGMCC 1.3604]|uniref:Dephospho-CoA kinase n=1 Tax=Alkalihalobacillus alcalophilus ATCC 27647 = CGMCC 1.3604 TaxID=1218173 RepID=A0A094YWF0_ALKAL|nr:dephospho-CoA kinase [Alkalihalobacillus alcalophilus]KGA97842.1 dephospho-CoA kinase [Alkalihalobacillus alcalophilus ATCC 27647 = CGMCC 1.3604]MED1563881.1 dephospho-CoA kinase [Alkalihalobacillus alcalophilus]THG90245.1 dephospho-CoA kinase [Alkalihalobacillus alcalophilus ATCC 27647 = CGMCC 1.3604]
MSLIIGLTGGIASGKSTVSTYLKQKGIPIVDADKIAREVVEPDEDAYKKIVETFGEEVVTSDETLHRKRLGEIVFNDPLAREKLNKIVHPAVRQRMVEEKNRWLNEGYQTVVLDIPLLFESDLFHLVDKVLLVYVDEETQLSRLMARDQSTKEAALKRIQAQMPLKEKVERADAIISNNDVLEKTYEQIEQLISDWKICAPSP